MKNNKKEKQISLKTALTILVISTLLTGGIVYVLASPVPSTPSGISPGIYPGAPTYTVWKEGSNYFAKDAYGLLQFSGDNASTLMLSIKNDMTVGLIYAAAANYVMDIPFPDTDVSDEIVICGQGNQTRFTSSGYFTALDLEKIRVMMLIYEDSEGLEHYVTDLTPKYLDSFINTQMSVKQLDFSSVAQSFGYDFINGSAGWAIGRPMITAFKGIFYIANFHEQSRKTIITSYTKDGTFLFAKEYTDARIARLGHDDTKIYGAEWLCNTSESNNIFYEIDPQTLEKTSLTSIDHDFMTIVHGIIPIGNYIYVPGEWAPESPRLLKINKADWSYSEITVTSFGAKALFDGIYVEEKELIYFGGHANTRGILNVTNDAVSEWNIPDFTFSVIPFALDTDTKSMLVGEAGSGNEANQKLYRYFYLNDTYSDITPANPEAGKWGGYWHRYLQGIYIQVGNDAYFNDQGGSQQFHYDYTTWRNVSVKFDVAAEGYEVDKGIGVEGMISTSQGLIEDANNLYFIDVFITQSRTIVRWLLVIYSFTE